MEFGEKEQYYNRIGKPLLGGSSHFTVDESGRVFSVYTPHDPSFNSKVVEVEDPSPGFVTELGTKRDQALAMLNEVVIDPYNADQSASDRVFLENSGIDPTSI